jgi:hypothetical protein
MPPAVTGTIPQHLPAMLPATQSSETRRRADVRYCGALLGIVVLTFAIHEAGHYLVGRLLGYQMTVTLNSASPVGAYGSSLHAALADLGGPAVTLLQALVAVALIQRGSGMLAYGFLFAAFMMRLLAAGVSVFHPNDEARISMAMGLGPWVLPALVVAALGLMLAYAYRRLDLHWSVNVWSWIVASIGVAMVVIVDVLVFG